MYIDNSCNDNSEKLTVSTSSLFLPEFFDL